MQDTTPAATRDRRAYRNRGSEAAAGYRSHGIAQALSALLAALMLAGGATASGDDAGGDLPSDDEAAVLAVVDALFDGMREKDAELMRSQFIDGARLGTLAVSDFVARVTANEAHLDEITFDETVLIDDDLAMAWTPYNIFIDGDFHHCGVDLFTLRRSGGRWLITHLEDTRRTEGCDPARR